ncbi:MAG: NAD+ synthase [Nitrososphaeraceae archaeon]
MFKDKNDHIAVCNTIVNFIREEVQKRRSKGIVVGLSGGIDSSVVGVLAVKALGNKKVFGLILPDSSVTPESDTKDAIKLAKNLKINYKVIQLKKIKKELAKNLPKNKMAVANLLVRLRMSVLYYYATVKHSLVLGTGDKSEIMLGYYTKYGDGGVDLFPIGELYKTEVRSLAEYLEIPIKIINKKSSARLWKGQTAEKELGIEYEEIDKILQFLENKNIKPSLSASPIITKRKILKVKLLIEKNQHKQEMPPLCKLK